MKMWPFLTTFVRTGPRCRAAQVRAIARTQGREETVRSPAGDPSFGFPRFAESLGAPGFPGAPNPSPPTVEGRKGPALISV
ncbi:hypothetical protein BD293_4266 [Roseinatronobacter monicus]|uniref:Uncharacterized protein n=1 Tax=Roseinatronobacter monicus TaxID=393481 RepID=A0A543K4D9_9RHOB|nr:hypothetical protein BD293_4266 [Roseinatronobacter monicus]